MMRISWTLHHTVVYLLREIVFHCEDAFSYSIGNENMLDGNCKI
jgi:hypothetical protein